MGTSVSHNQTQKNYKPPMDEEVVQTQLNERPGSNEPRQSNQYNAGPVEAGQERKISQSALPPRQPNKMTNSVLMDPQSNNNRGPKQQSQSHLRPPSSSFRAGSVASSAINSSDRVIQLNQSKIYVHTEKFNDKNMEISAIKVKGF